MRYLKGYNESNNIDAICEQYGIQNYMINRDGSIDVDGKVDLDNKGLDELPLKFGRIKVISTVVIIT